MHPQHRNWVYQLLSLHRITTTEFEESKFATITDTLASTLTHMHAHTHTLLLPAGSPIIRPVIRADVNSSPPNIPFRSCDLLEAWQDERPPLFHRAIGAICSVQGPALWPVLQRKLKRSQPFPVCLGAALSWPVAAAKRGTLSGLVHCGRLISTKKLSLQAAVNSDGCFSAPGTLGGAATGELPNKNKKRWVKKKITQGDSGKNGCWTNNVYFYSANVSVHVW